MNVEKVIIGAGYYGLQKAYENIEKSKDDLLVIEFEDIAGGKPWQMAKNQKEHPFEIWLKSTVIEMKQSSEEGYILKVQHKGGITSITAKVVIITTGAVEKPRSLNMIPGDRPGGEMTSKLALSLLAKGYIPGYKPLIFVENEDSQELVFELNKIKECHVTTLQLGQIDILSIHGEPRVNQVLVKHKETGEIETIECDACIYSNGLVPNTKFLKELNLECNEENFILADEAGVTNLKGVYAFGDCSVRP
ncbi:NAD(P)/FAD-dependent oxidoreductase [Oceanobacillus sojae]|uniref:NAD(P)/FAD-dependent oxidoreductase n=1 Tax=Oceanobacillus sojae TaxID=582851 RepID=UPI0021A4059A|nr:FAD-dependent oxidoreductase [Oceanobacillus sojae]MCT1901490.1 FAD-dependent oxidoreductase [Oceanobacillus sojae]